MSSRIIFVILTLLFASLACNLANSDADTTNQKVVTEERPTVVMLAPANNTTFQVGTKVNFHAVARDLVDGVARIEFVIDVPGNPVTLIQNSTNPNGDATLEAIVSWEAVGNQTLLVEVRAFRADGTPSNSEQISIAVVGGSASVDTTTDPAVTPPADGTTDTAPPVDLTLPEGSIEGVIVGEPAPVRQGPATTYATVTTLEATTTVQIAGRSTDNLWYVIRMGEGFGWVLQPSVQVTVDTSTLPVVEAPPVLEQ